MFPPLVYRLIGSLRFKNIVSFPKEMDFIISENQHNFFVKFVILNSPWIVFLSYLQIHLLKRWCKSSKVPYLINALSNKSRAELSMPPEQYSNLSFFISFFKCLLLLATCFRNATENLTIVTSKNRSNGGKPSQDSGGLMQMSNRRREYKNLTSCTELAKIGKFIPSLRMQRRQRILAEWATSQRNL